MRKSKFILGMVFSLSVLAGCGGGGNSSESSAQTSIPPASTSEHTSEVTSAAESSSEEESSAEESTSILDTSTHETGLSSEESSDEDTSTEEESSATEQSSPVESSSSSGLSEATITIHFFKKNCKYAEMAVWLWPDGGEGAEYVFDQVDHYGGFLTVGLADWKVNSGEEDSFKLGYIVKEKGTWNKDVDMDRFIEFKGLPNVDGDYHIWVKSGDEATYDYEPRTSGIIAAYFDSFRVIHIEATADILNVKVYKDGEIIKQIDDVAEGTSVMDITIDEDGDLRSSYSVLAQFDDGATSELSVNTYTLYDTEEFDAQYVYEGNDLGAVYAPEETTFKVWTPISTKVELRVYENGTPFEVNPHIGSNSFDAYEMTKGDKGVFSYTLDGDQDGKYYTYVVYNSRHPKGVEVVDPYAKSAGVNGLRGMVVNFSKTNPTDWDDVTPHQYDRKELAVYETHVADVTSSETWNGDQDNAKKFRGLVEKGTTYEGFATGFDHIKELGVNAVQLLPIFDQDNDEVNVEFNWGYNPLNYNVVEGCYSSDPYDGYARIRELKEVVKEYHDAGINIIMDVVYNHVMDAGKSNFEMLMPGYYFRLNPNGTYSSGSGCGNETASDRAMFNKFMKDSTAFWASEYKLGGFRFDLMALHDLDTMAEVVDNLETINPSIVVYGEPWTGGGTPLPGNKQCSLENAKYFDGFGCFDDKFRDAMIMSGMKGVDEYGWANGSLLTMQAADIVGGIKGKVGGVIDPDKDVSYVSCHDNRTLLDRFIACDEAQEKPVSHTTEEYKRMAELAQAASALSQGTFFMLAGEEFARTKGGDHNSYKSSYKVNELDYSRLVDYEDMYELYKVMIDLKKNSYGLHLDSIEADQMNVERINRSHAITYTFEADEYIYKVALANINRAEGITIDVSGYRPFYSNVWDAVLPDAFEDNDFEIRPGEVLIAREFRLK